MDRKRTTGAGQRLFDTQRLITISRNEQVPRVSNRQLAREFDVSEKAIRRILLGKDEIRERTAGRVEEVRQNTFHGGRARFPELESRLND